MKKALFAALAALATATMSLAIDINTATWTGAGDGVSWTDEHNWWKEATDGWTGEQAPYTANAVVVDGDNGIFTGNPKTVVYSGALTLPVSVTLLNGAVLNVGSADPAYALNITTEGGVNRTITGGTVVCNYVEIQATSKLTISDAHLKTTTDRLGRVGIYQNGGAYINIVDGENKSAQFSYRTSGVASPYQTFFSGENPVMRYNDSALDEATFSTLFQAVNNSDGTTTLSFKVQEGWNVGTVAVNSVADGQAAVSFTVTKYSGGTATVSIGCATSDLGDDIDSWVGSLTQLATGVSATTSYNETVPLENGVNYIRVFVTYDDKTTASFAAVARSIAYGDYGELTGVYEFIGDDNDLSKATNWALNKTPLSENDTAPTAETDIRWFGRNANYSGSLAIYDKDVFSGATLNLSGDTFINADVYFTNSTVNIYTINVADRGAPILNLYGSSLTTTRNDQWLGVYPPGTYTGSSTKTFVNFLSGKVSSFTFTDNAINITDADSAKTALVTPGYLKLDGAAIADSDWNAFFSVDVSGKTIKITYNPVVDENKISSVAFSDVTATSATLTATIFSIAEGASVVVAYDTAEITEANVIAKGETVNVSEGVATKAVTSLASGNVYNYAFAIVQDNEVKAFKSGLFFASDFNYVYMNGAWQGNAPATLDTDASVLFLDSYNNGINDLAVANTVVSNAAIASTGTIKGVGTMQVYSSQITNNKVGDAGAVCGTWGGSTYMNFVSLSGNGVVYPACSYTFNAAEEWKNNAYSLLFDDERIHLNGAKVDQATYEANFTLVQNSETGNEVTPYNLTVTYWESVLGGGSSTDWTIQPGARVKLDRDIRVGALNIPDAADVKIDLNGHKLTVSSLTVGGVTMKGEFTSSDLGCLVGEGSLAVAGNGLVIVIR